MGPIPCSCCGADLPRFAPEGLCPTCLLEAIDDPESDFTNQEDLTPEEPPPDTLPPPDQALRQEPRPVPGQLFGPYHILRRLGRGGMGEVYEAEHREQGRRVALKVLNQQLDGEDHRARFIREGQMAAAINHPNSVYLFASEEIAGTPVIAMELLSGGTLKDRVRDGGPLPSPAAVDAMLQVIAGLTVAEAAGMLHRDIKPANCFVGADGVVKIGDFGLSISTTAQSTSGIIGPSAFQGTPQFASPEQLRGDAFDVRADIYGVGATLYFLLTGQPPFDGGGDVPTSIARIANERNDRPRWSGAARRVVPRDLVAVVNDCLAKRPDGRPATYAQLVERLQPFSSAVTSAGWEPRLAAAGFDWAILSITALFTSLMISVRIGESPSARVFGWLLVALATVYWTVLTGVWGPSYGKRQFHLRVVTSVGERVGLARAFVRTVVALLPLMLAVQLKGGRDLAFQQSGVSWAVAVEGLAIGVALLFSLARSSNGYEGLHDMLTGTRVVTRQRLTAPPSPIAAPSAPLAHSFPSVVVAKELRHIGPYDVGWPVATTDVGEILHGFDPRLKRPVWIHVVPPDTPALPALAHGLSRPGRLHWLSGRRGPTGGWDAYDEPAGQPLLNPDRHIVRQPWTIARQCLLDLARELEAGLADNSLDSLHIDRVWFTNDGHAKLLDFRAPGAPGAPWHWQGEAPDTPVARVAALVASQLFLRSVAGCLLDPASIPRLPLSVGTFLRTLAHGEFATMGDVVAALERLATRPDVVTQTQRGMSLALCVLGVRVGDWLLPHLIAAPSVAPTVHHVTVGQALSFRNFGDPTWAALGILCAAVLHSGFWLRVSGIAVVTEDGQEASRLRAMCRAAIAWSWVPADVIATVSGWFLLLPVISILKLAALLYAGQNPERGVQDRLAGTYLVPR